MSSIYNCLISLFAILDAIKGESIPLIHPNTRKDLVEAQAVLLEKIRDEHNIALSGSESTKEKAAILHLQEQGLVEVENQKITSTKALQLFDAIQDFLCVVEDIPENISLYTLYQQKSEISS